MPCNTIQTATIKLEAAQPELLKAALAALGITQFTYQNGVLTIPGRTTNASLIQQVKQQYGKAVVMSQAKKFGWQVKETAPFQYQITKR